MWQEGRGRACRRAGAGDGLRWGMCCEVGGECTAQLAGVHRCREGERKCAGRACRRAGAGDGLRWGMGGEGGEECMAQRGGVRLGCGRASALRGGAKVLGQGVSLCGDG